MRHPGPREASGTLLGTEYTASSRIQGASSPRGKSSTQLGIGHPAASGVTGENLGPGWASGTWGYLRSGGASRTGWASHVQQHPIPAAPPAGASASCCPLLAAGDNGRPGPPKPLGSPLGLTEPRKQQSRVKGAGRVLQQAEHPLSPTPPQPRGWQGQGGHSTAQDAVG